MMTTYYTAVGRLETRRAKGGELRCPIIQVRQQECYVDLQEMVIWSSLNWRICTEAQIGEHYRKATQGTPLRTNRSWQDCLQRLIVRNLVRVGHGESEFDALYSLVAPLYIFPTQGSLPLRLASFAKLTLLNGVPVHTAAKLFRRDKRTEREQQIMRLAGDTVLSTAEMVKCAVLGVRHIPSELAVVEYLYNDDFTTDLNMIFQMRPEPLCPEVTVAIANLYLRQQIIFDLV